MSNLPSEIKVHLGKENRFKCYKRYRTSKPTLYNEADAKILTGPCKVYTREEIEQYILNNGR